MGCACDSVAAADLMRQDFMTLQPQQVGSALHDRFLVDTPDSQARFGAMLGNMAPSAGVDASSEYPPSSEAPSLQTSASCARSSAQTLSLRCSA